MNAQKRDVNERAIIVFLTSAGCGVRQMDKSAGFDLLVLCPRTGIHIVEIKNPDVRWYLTEKEMVMKDTCEHHWVKYEIVETIEQAQAIIELETA